jgi:hypothetical protein
MKTIKIILLVLVGISLMGAGFIYAQPSRFLNSQKSHVIAVLATGLNTLVILRELKKLVPAGFELFEVKDEAEAKHERFWGILFVKHEIRAYETRWMIRKQAEERRVEIRLRPMNKIFSTNWENLAVKGSKEPGPSFEVHDWKIVSEWAEVPPLVIKILASDMSVLVNILNDNSAAIRAEAARKLGELKDERALVALIAALKDEDSHVRWWAAYALGELKDPRAVEALIAKLKDEDTSIRECAERALENITGRDFGVDPIKWRKWWEENRAKFLR